MAKRVLALFVLAVSLLITAPAAMAQVPNSPYLVPPSGREQLRPVAVGGVELARTPPRAAAGAGSEGAGEDTLPVTGGDLAGLAAVGAACIAVGVVLRRRRLQPTS
jgi:hypothetical protein